MLLAPRVILSSSIVLVPTIAHCVVYGLLRLRTMILLEELLMLIKPLNTWW